MYKVVSWVTFKTQCEQSDTILRTTFKCSANQPTQLFSSEEPALDIPNTNDCESVNNLFESDNVATSGTVDAQFEQLSKQFPEIENNWSVSQTEDKTENNESSINYDNKLHDEADEDEVKQN